MTEMPDDALLAIALASPDASAALVEAMQRAALLERPAPTPALAWVDTFARAFAAQCPTVAEALPAIRALRAEGVVVAALDLERLRNRAVLFFLDSVSQYVDAAPELRDLPISHDVAAIASEFGIAATDASWAVRVALTAQASGPPFEALFPLLGHDRIMMRIGAINAHVLHGRGLEPLAFGPGGVPFATIEGARPT